MVNPKQNKLKKVLSTVLSSVVKDSPNPKGLTIKRFEAFFDTYADSLKKTITNNGKEYALKLFKELNDQAIRSVTNETITPIPFHKSNKDGISTLLIPVLDILHGTEYKEIRIVLSVTRLHEQIRLPPELLYRSNSKPLFGN